MGTTRTFSTMLNEYLPNKLLKEDFIKQDYLLSKVEKDETWLGGNLVVPFKAAGASSIAFGSLSATADISQDLPVRGGVSGHKEVWGSLLFNHRDIMEHDKLSEQNLLKILPDMVDDFLEKFRNKVSVNLLNGPHFATLTADATAAGGVITVDRPDRFDIGQPVTVNDTGASPISGFVTAININSSTVTLVTAQSDVAGGTNKLDFSGSNKLVSLSAKCYHPGSQTLGFSDLRSALLSSANGGSTTLYGQTKTAYPYLQTINVSGASCTLSNLMEKIFNVYTITRRLGKGKPTSVLMSLNNYGVCLQIVEASKGAYNVTPKSASAVQFGWDTLTVGSVTGNTLELVGVQEMDDDIIMYIDWRALKFYSNGFFKKRKSPDGIEYFETRSTTAGYQYIVDICLFGDLIVERPSYCGIMYGISLVYPTTALA